MPGRDRKHPLCWGAAERGVGTCPGALEWEGCEHLSEKFLRTVWRAVIGEGRDRRVGVGARAGERGRGEGESGQSRAWGADTPAHGLASDSHAPEAEGAEVTFPTELAGPQDQAAHRFRFPLATVRPRRLLRLDRYRWNRLLVLLNSGEVLQIKQH